MFRLMRAPAAVSLFAAVALSVALFAASDASKAERSVPEGSAAGASVSGAHSGAGVPDGPSAPLPYEGNPGEAQYSSEEGDSPFEPPRAVAPQRDAGVDPPAPSPYYDFYDG